MSAGLAGEAKRAQEHHAEKLVLTRDVPMSECHWLERDYKEGEVVYEYTGYTHGVCGPSGTMTSEVPNEAPSTELPTDALRVVEDEG